MAVAQKQRVLVVDDEPQVLVALEDLLADGYMVLKSQSGEHALCLAEEHKDIAVILTDQRMPNMTGDQLLATLRDRSRASRVLVTGYADLTAVVRAVNEGRIFAYVDKPWDPKRLRITVDKAAEHFRLQRELAAERRVLVDLMSSVSDGIYIKDAELRFRMCNGVFAAQLQAAGADDVSNVEGRTLADVLGREVAEPIEAEEVEVLATGKAKNDVVRAVMRGDEKRWYSTSQAPIHGVGSDIEGIVGIVRDVTERRATDEALRVSEERLRLVVAGTAAGLFDWDVRTGFVYYSDELFALLGERPGDLEPSFSALMFRIHPSDVDVVTGRLENHRDEGTPPSSIECRIRVASGEYRWFGLSAMGVRDESGERIRLVGAIHDITARKRQEERIANLSRIRALTGAVNVSMLHLPGRDALLSRACSIAVREGGLAMALAFGRGAESTMELVACDSLYATLRQDLPKQLNWAAIDEAPEARRALSEGRPYVVNDVTALGKSGYGARLAERGCLAFAAFPLLVGDTLDAVYLLVSRQAGYFDTDEVALVAELTSNLQFALEHEAKSQRLSFLLSHDSLTGLARRELFVDRLQQRLAACQPGQPYLAVFWVDISRFRQINEALGRAGGDELLRRVGERLVQAIDDADGVARFDANAFGVLSSALALEADSAVLLERVVAVLQTAPFLVGGTELRIAVTVGVAVHPTDGENAEELLSRCETAGKVAKAQGQPFLFYTARMNRRVAERLALENKLRRAIDAREFLLHYQPKVDAKTGRVVGFEALVRWNDPDSGLVPPGAFIPVLEETGLILPVGAWVLEEAARQFSAWRESGHEPPRIAVNVSAIQLADSAFASSVDRVVERYPLARQGIDLEITESVLMGEFASNVDKLRMAREVGFGVAIDDFGTGYSSLGYLNRLPLDALKVDRSFVAKMDQDAQDMSLVMTIISLAHSLGLKVIAEGVETAIQARLLGLLRCDQIQGFLVSRPVPADQAVRTLTETYSFMGTSLRPEQKS